MRLRPLGGTGLTVSELGFGTSPLGPAAAAAVHTALELGITFFDVSPYYGATRAERVLGTALRGVDRSRYVLATKVGRYGPAEFDFGARRVERSVHESLDRLGTDHLDLVQCHDIEFGDLDQIVGETIPALRALQAAGLVGAVGVTGYPLPALAHVAERVPVDTVLSYSRYTLQDRGLAAWRDTFTGLGAADPVEVRRNVEWLDAPVDPDLLRDVEECLAPVRDVGWSNGRPENQQPGGPR